MNDSQIKEAMAERDNTMCAQYNAELFNNFSSTINDDNANEDQWC